MTQDPTKIRDLEKDDKRTKEAKKLYKKQAELKDEHTKKALLEKIALATKLQVVDVQLQMTGAHARSEARRMLKGEERSTNLPTGGSTDDPVAVKQEWARIYPEYVKTKNTWAVPALDSEKQFQKTVSNYSKAMDPLIKAFQKAQTTNIPAVKGEAEEATEKLQAAQGSLEKLKENCAKAVVELEGFIGLIEFLKDEPPGTFVEIKSTQGTYNESIQKVRRTEQDLKDQVIAIDAKSKEWQKDLESLIKAMVTAAIAWDKTKKVGDGVEVVGGLLNGTVAAVQTLDSEPMSALAVQGVHMGIKALCDTIRVSAAGIKVLMIRAEKQDVLVLLDDLNADAFVQMKLDLFIMGFTWLTEPLGFIPNVGALVRGTINTLVGQLVKTLKAKAEYQAKELKQQKSGKAVDEFKESLKEVGNGFRELAVAGVAKALEGIVEAIAKPEEKLLQFILGLVNEALGVPMQKLLARVLGDFDLVDADAVKETVQSGRDAVDAGQKKVQKMLKIEMNFGFDEKDAYSLTVMNLGKLSKKGDSSQVIVVASEELKAAGVALLIGDDLYTKDQKAFVTSLLEAEHGFKGKVELTKEKKGVFGKAELVFTFTDKQAEKWIREYKEHWKGLTVDTDIKYVS
jgi:hypothetical protein